MEYLIFILGAVAVGDMINSDQQAPGISQNDNQNIEKVNQDYFVSMSNFNDIESKNDESTSDDWCNATAYDK